MPWPVAGPRPGSGGRALGRDESREVVLLAHQPKQIFEAVEQGVGLQLSGHTHSRRSAPLGLHGEAGSAAPRGPGSPRRHADLHEPRDGLLGPSDARRRPERDQRDRAPPGSGRLRGPVAGVSWTQFRPRVARRFLGGRDRGLPSRAPLQRVSGPVSTCLSDTCDSGGGRAYEMAEGPAGGLLGAGAVKWRPSGRMGFP